MVNQPPSITSNPPQAATVGNLYAYDLKGSDPDNDPLTWSLDTAPQGMSIDPSLGTLRWTPTADELGSQNVVVRLTDSQGGYATQSYAIIVRAVNLPPSISSVPPTTADTADTYTYAVRATDPQGLPSDLQPDHRAHRHDDRPDTPGSSPGAPPRPSSARRTWRIQVDDGQGGIATQTYAVVVTSTPTDQPPVITSTPSQLATVGQPYQYQVTAKDPEGQALTYVLLTKPDRHDHRRQHWPGDLDARLEPARVQRGRRGRGRSAGRGRFAVVRDRRQRQSTSRPSSTRSPTSPSRPASSSSTTCTPPIRAATPCSTR